MIKNAMTFKQISDLLDVPVAELQFLNPSYKREEVPYITGENHFCMMDLRIVTLLLVHQANLKFV